MTDAPFTDLRNALENVGRAAVKQRATAAAAAVAVAERHHRLCWWEGNLAGVAFVAAVLAGVLGFASPRGSFVGGVLVWLLLAVAVPALLVSRWIGRRIRRQLP